MRWPKVGEFGWPSGAKADVAMKATKRVTALLMRAFFMGGFVPDCHTQIFVEVAKLEGL